MTTQTILVTGATGNVGGEVVRGLAEWNTSGVKLRIRAAVRADDGSGGNLHPFPAGVERVTFDFTRPDTYAAAFQGVNTMFLMRPPALSNIARDMQPALEAAHTAGVRHVVLLSLLGAERNRFVPHAKIEDALRHSNMANMTWTFLRAGFFMQNLTTTHLTEIRDRSEIYIPAGHGKTSFIDVRDIAAVAVRILTDNDQNGQNAHTGQIYPLTGNEALDYEQVAAILSEVLGRTIRYRNPSPLAYMRTLRKHGQAWDYIAVLTAIYATTRFGLAASITNDVGRLLGRAPISFRQFAADHRAMWERTRRKVG